MNRLVKAILATALAFVLLQLWFGPYTAESWANLAVRVGVLLVLALLVKGAAALWRAARGVRVTTVAHTAGALASKVQRRAAGITQAFKDGKQS